MLEGRQPVPVTEAFALRMPPELKRAAKALTEVGFLEPGTHEGTFNHICPRSINDAIVYLTRTGIRQTLACLEKEIIRVREEHALWQEFVSFFMNNPTADMAFPVNFPEGSTARRWISDALKETESVLQDGEDPNDYGCLVDGVNRASAADEFARSQRMLMKLIDAKGMLQKALISPPPVPFPITALTRPAGSAREASRD
jgi:hypothetical protein